MPIPYAIRPLFIQKLLKKMGRFYRKSGRTIPAAEGRSDPFEAIEASKVQHMRHLPPM